MTRREQVEGGRAEVACCWASVRWGCLDERLTSALLCPAALWPPVHMHTIVTHLLGVMQLDDALPHRTQVDSCT